MDWVVLRLIHILSGAFWLGAAATLFLFLQPTARATAPEGHYRNRACLARRPASFSGWQRRWASSGVADR